MRGKNAESALHKMAENARKTHSKLMEQALFYGTKYSGTTPTPKIKIS